MTSPRSRSVLPILAFLAGAIVLAAAVWMSFGRTEPPSAATASAIGGPFTLKTGNGKVVTAADEKGKPFLVFFGYTHCPDVCPTTLAEISNVFKKLGVDAKVAALFITVDPARDTPASMQDYASSFDPRIIGLSGTEKQVDAAMKAYHVYAARIPGKGGDYSMAHSAIVYLMDKEGRFVNAFNLERPPAVAAEELSAYL